MFSRLLGAILRAVLIVLLIVMPSVMLSVGNTSGSQVVTLTAIFGALFTVVEYGGRSPSLVEFREAPPFNRMRFFALFLTVFAISIIFRGEQDPTSFSMMFQTVGARIGSVIDFPFSPVRLMVLIMPPETSPNTVDAMRTAAGLSYLISIVSIIWFIILLRLRRWPPRTDAFNVLVNLPTFDPTAGGDVVRRLNRDGQINVILGFLLPFFIPGLIQMGARLGATLSLDDPQTLIWTVSAWAFLPASLLMRGVALTRIAQMIQVQRDRAYAKAAQDDTPRS